ncbi:MAG: hypothetical protein QMO91_08450 [Candidatus Tisiphia sp.]|nr:hypothetical protein [Candidatus Tisiphia sp.]
MVESRQFSTVNYSEGVQQTHITIFPEATIALQGGFSLRNDTSQEIIIPNTLLNAEHSSDLEALGVTVIGANVNNSVE